MKKLYSVAFAVLLLGCSLQAQVIVPGHAPRRGYTHSNTIVSVKPQGEFHGFVDMSAGIHVYSSSRAVNPMTNMSAGLVYEYGGGFMLGAAFGMGFLRERNYYDESRISSYPEMRPMAVLGYKFNSGPGPGSMFLMFNPGVYIEDGKDGFELESFSGDIKIGYTYMFKRHFGLSVSTGMSGSVDSWMSIPITVGVVF